ncbi:MAG TPA: hypothetical protein VM101_02555 [Flavitalea sp.]|nr:hypothetical protein [Flavitalea sp.]
MDLAINQKSTGYKPALILMAILFCTYLRVSLLLIYPAIVIICFYIFHWKLDRNILIVSGLIILFWIASLRNGFFIKYNLVSFYYFIPFILLLFARPLEVIRNNYLNILMSALTVIIIINDIAGIIQYIRKPNDDSFIGFYGIFTVSQNGLSIVNSILFFYYLTSFQVYRKITHFLLLMFFLICTVLGFYGAGLMVFLAAIFLTYLKISKKNILNLIVISLLTLGIIILLMKLISPYTYEYNLAIVNRFLHPTPQTIPRKLIIFQNYAEGYTSNFLDLLFGSGPGTFNSRTAFMVGSPTYFNVDIIKSEAKPYYFNNYAYTLWNPGNTGPYDGFMNQPFTSILALLGEYGLIVTVLIITVVVSNFMRLKRFYSEKVINRSLLIPSDMYKFCSYNLLFLIIIDNYIEYPEIIGLILIIIKLSHQQLLSNYILPSSKKKVLA